MTPVEAESVIRDIIQLWPVWNPESRQGLLRKKLAPFEFDRARQGVDDLGDTAKGMPSWADIRESIFSIKGEVVNSSCSICSSTGWIFTDLEAQCIVVKCECNGDVNPRACELAGFNSEGKAVATRSESYSAITCGIRVAQPGWSEEMIDVKAKEFLPKSHEEYYSDVF